MAKTHDDTGFMYLGVGNFDDDGLLLRFHPDPLEECNQDAMKTKHSLTLGQLLIAWSAWCDKNDSEYMEQHTYDATDDGYATWVNEKLMCHNKGCGKAD